jgi:hypothetical protein
LCKFQGGARWYAVGGFTLDFPYPPERKSQAFRLENLHLTDITTCHFQKLQIIASLYKIVKAENSYLAPSVINMYTRNLKLKFNKNEIQ